MNKKKSAQKKLEKWENTLRNSIEKKPEQWMSANVSEMSEAKQIIQWNMKHRKEERINIRITTGELEGIKIVAAQEGLPYQTLIASILHKFVTKQLVPPSRDGQWSIDQKLEEIKNLLTKRAG